MDRANADYQDLEGFRGSLSNLGRPLTLEEQEIRAKKITDFMRELDALSRDPTIDHSALPKITPEHIRELEEFRIAASAARAASQAALQRARDDLDNQIPINGFNYSGREKSIMTPPTFAMSPNSALKWPAFKEQIIQYFKLCNYRQKTAVIALTFALEAKTRAMVAHIKPDTYSMMPDGNGLWFLLEQYGKIFQAGSETGIPLAQFARTTQGRMDLHTFHATLRSFYRDAYPTMSAEELDNSSELQQKFIDGLISLKIKEHVIRNRKVTWNTYAELLNAALHEQATQVNVSLTTASSQAALQAGLTPAQLIREQEGIFAPAAPQRSPPRQPQAFLPPAEPMEIGAMEGDKCKWCPEKDRPGFRGHTVENCWKIQRAMREYNEKYNDGTVAKTATPARFPARKNYTPRPFNAQQGFQGPRTPFRGNQRSFGQPRPNGPRGRPFRRQITAAILDDCDQGLDPEEAINYHLATLGIEDEPLMQGNASGGEDAEHVVEVSHLHDQPTQGEPTEFAEFTEN